MGKRGGWGPRKGVVGAIPSFSLLFSKYIKIKIKIKRSFMFSFFILYFYSLFLEVLSFAKGMVFFSFSGSFWQATMLL